MNTLPSGEHRLDLPAAPDTIPAPAPSPDDTWPDSLPASPIFDLWHPPPPSDIDAASRL